MSITPSLVTAKIPKFGEEPYFKIRHCETWPCTLSSSAFNHTGQSMARMQAGFVYVGIKTSVLALDRKTGEIVWAVKLPVKYGGSTVSGLANVWCEPDALFASCAGEIFCLDPKSGTILWHNLLKKMGTGFVSIATEGSLPRTTGVAAGAAAAIAAAAASRTAAS